MRRKRYTKKEIDRVLNAINGAIKPPVSSWAYAIPITVNVSQVPPPNANIVLDPLNPCLLTCNTGPV